MEKMSGREYDLSAKGCIWREGLEKVSPRGEMLSQDLKEVRGDPPWSVSGGR